ncbi:tetratricopeptide repeat protein [Phenylobacterium montanum]|uniref:Tetratricopeptide repeat protein n=1 Tax=Phenylobacterium montanum TaxID=2823693 RepID=A0A975IUT0_9CAUL|nr:hypothetical protein [Caulobacter sp. S6]QUD86566.1 hypothetical protein KCG34_15915 [Caulobacter sp. S6]
MRSPPRIAWLLLALLSMGLVALVLARPAADTPEVTRAKALIAAGRSAEAEPVLARLAARGDARTRLYAYRAWAQILGPQRGDFPGFMDRQRHALALDPASAELHLGLYQGESVLGHDGAAALELQEAVRSAFRVGPLRLGARWMTPPGMQALVYRSHGDFAAAAREDAESLKGDPPGSPAARADQLNLAGDRILNHDLSAVIPPPAPGAAPVEAVLAARDQAWADLAREDWAGAAKVLSALEGQPLPPPMKNTLPVLTRPWLAYALFKKGDAAGARAELAATPADCALCQRIRGRIAAQSGDAAGAEQAFGKAIDLSAGLPFAYVDRGRARMARGDVAGALADGKAAVAASPNNPDARDLIRTATR